MTTPYFFILRSTGININSRYRAGRVPAGRGICFTRQVPALLVGGLLLPRFEDVIDSSLEIERCAGFLECCAVFSSRDLMLCFVACMLPLLSKILL